MKRLMSLLIISLWVMCICFAAEGETDEASTYEIVYLKDIPTDGSLTGFSASADLLLDMSKITSYDIGFSDDSGGVNRITSWDIVPFISDDFSKISASGTRYFYWDIVSNLKLSFKIGISGPLINGDKEMNWTVTAQRPSSEGGAVVLSSAENSVGPIEFCRYERKNNELGNSGIRAIQIGLSESLSNISIGTYEGVLYLVVGVES